MIGPAMQALIDAEIEKAKDAWAWEIHLLGNEVLYGSAYGPWLPPKEFIGLSGIL